MAESGWAEMLGDSMKDRVQLLGKFFDDAARDNSGRAVRKEPPMDHETATARWVKTAAAAFPMLSLAGVSQQMLTMGAAARPAAGTAGAPGRGGRQGKGNRGGQGGQGGQPGNGGSAGGQARGSGSAAAAGNTGIIKTPARWQGLPVCFQYNGAGGCKRPPQGTQCCKEANGNTVYAHVCNFLTVGQNGATGTHCLAAHPRFGNH